MIMSSADKWHISLKSLEELPPRILHQLELYEEMVGSKQRRIYSIPAGCLYLDTHRGCLPYTQTTDTWFIEDIGHQHKTYQHLTDCAFWNTLWHTFRAGESDEDWETFCRVAFPEDIPDEWSLEERAKSHGPGPNNPGEELFWRRWLRKWFTTSDQMYYLQGVGSIICEIIVQFVINEVNYGWNMAELFQHLDTALIAKGHSTRMPLAPEAFVASAPDPLMNQLLGKMDRLVV
jgi:hypothetical protein